MSSIQQSFTSPIDRSKEVLQRCANQFDPDHILLAVSGGTDSVVAADVFARLGPEYGLEPDAVIHYNTGTGVPQSRLCAKLIADMHGLDYVEETYRKLEHSLAHRILANGWLGGYAGSPATGGHGLEWANRKGKVGREIYMSFEGFQVWVSGARKLESKKRKGNVPDSGVQKDKPRRAWLSIIGGWTSSEKQQYIKERGLPVSEAYLVLGFSGECTACAFDEVGLLTNIDLLCPELGYALRSLATWLYQRVKRGDVDLDPKQLCWGWKTDETIQPDDQSTLDGELSQTMVGCDEESCSTRESLMWVLDLPDDQIVTRSDVKKYWQTDNLPTRFPV